MSIVLSREELAALKGALRADSWDVVVKCLAAYVAEMHEQEITGANAFEALRALHTRQGGIAALNEFFEGLERYVA